MIIFFYNCVDEKTQPTISETMSQLRYARELEFDAKLIFDAIQAEIQESDLVFFERAGNMSMLQCDLRRIIVDAGMSNYGCPLNKFIILMSDTRKLKSELRGNVISALHFVIFRSAVERLKQGAGEAACCDHGPAFVKFAETTKVICKECDGEWHVYCLRYMYKMDALECERIQRPGESFLCCDCIRDRVAKLKQLDHCSF